MLSVSETEKLINEWIFNERNRSILKRRMLDGITYEQLAEEFDMSVSQIKRIVKDCTMLNFPPAITSSYETGKE